MLFGLIAMVFALTFGMAITAEAKFTDMASSDLFINTQGVSICERDGDLCGTGKTTMRSILAIESQLPDAVFGTADGVIRIQGISDSSGKIEPPKPLSFVYGKVTWTFTSSTNELTMSGTATSSNGEPYLLSMTGKQQEKTSQLAIPDWFFTYTLEGKDKTIRGFTIGTGTDILELIDKSAEK